MDYKLIGYKSVEYDKMVALRDEVLRKPLGLTFSEADLSRDTDDLLLVASASGNEDIIGCCILTTVNAQTVRLRQMAVTSSYQGKGVGRGLLMYAESVAKSLRYEYMHLHARETAVDFYKKQGYSVEGDLFIEVGIPHLEMRKRL